MLFTYSSTFQSYSLYPEKLLLTGLCSWCLNNTEHPSLSHDICSYKLLTQGLQIVKTYFKF